MTTYEQLPDHSRVWVFQSDKPLPDETVKEMEQKVQEFATQWQSHQKQLKAYGEIRYNRFIILIVDESAYGASGCSIDAMMHFMQSLAGEFEVDLFDRMRFSYVQNEQVCTVDSQEFAELYQQKKITDDTIVFDNLVTKKADFKQAWMKPLKQSWHNRFV